MVKKSNEPVVDKLSNKRDESFIASGIKEIDELIGGIPRGRITELWGAEGVGKTYLVSQLMVNLSKDHKILFVDTEFALNKQRVEQLGADIKNVDYIADSRLERVCTLLVNSIGKYDIIILDSLAYLTPLTVESNEIGDNSIGLFARLIKHWVVQFRPKLGTSETAFIAVNQFRATIAMYTKPEPPGGKSWGHAVDVRLHLTTNANDRKDDRGQPGHWLHLKVVKSKVSKPFQEAKIHVKY